MAYNGWANRNTWLVNLWFGDMFTDMAENGEKVTADLIESIVMEHIDEQIGSLGGIVADFIDYSGIDWHELAGHYVPEYEEEEE